MGPKRGAGEGEMIVPWGGFREQRTINLDLYLLLSVSMS